MYLYELRVTFLTSDTAPTGQDQQVAYLRKHGRWATRIYYSVLPTPEAAHERLRELVESHRTPGMSERETILESRSKLLAVSPNMIHGFTHPGLMVQYPGVLDLPRV